MYDTRHESKKAGFPPIIIIILITVNHNNEQADRIQPLDRQSPSYSISPYHTVHTVSTVGEEEDTVVTAAPPARSKTMPS